MPTIISSYIPFPGIAWWSFIQNADVVCFDKAEHFQKMSYRNKYHISGANGLIQLSIPLVGGRNQRSTMADMEISNSTPWQVQHWRTLTSVYKRAPYFDHYEQSMKELFDTPWQHLTYFNLASIHWLKKQLGLSFEEQFTRTYNKTYENVTDLRQVKPADEKNNPVIFPKYYQLFEDRVDFLPGLSMLDLLFSEGPYASKWIEENRAVLQAWSKREG